MLRGLVLSSFVVAAFVAGEESTTPKCEIKDLPLLPEYYTTEMLYNVGTRRDKSGSNRGPPPHTLGQSFSIFEMIDGRTKRASVEIIEEFGDQTQDLLLWKIIWNDAIDGVRNFINIVQGGIDNGGLMCYADDVADSSFMDWLFGFDPNNPQSSIPSVSSMLHFGVNYTSGCPENIKGIPCDVFHGHMDIAAWNASLLVTYYWSDPTVWHSSSGTGKSVPVRATISGVTNSPDGNGDFVFVDNTIEYQNFFEVEPPMEAFQPPADLFCLGREMHMDLPKMPNHYSFGSEVVYHWLSGEGEEYKSLKVVQPRDYWYDYKMKVARVDVKPIDFNANDPFDGREGVVSDIQDFSTGISYVIDQTIGNCSVSYLGADDIGQDIIINNGHVYIADPMHLFRMDQKFAFNGVYSDRGMVMDAYVANHPVSLDDPDLGNYTTVVWLSNSMYSVEDGSDTDRLLPVKVERYPTKDYNSPEMRVTTNIYHFKKQEPDFQDYDITPCFIEDQKMHITFAMTWNPAMSIEDTIYKFNKKMRAEICSMAEITPIRVQNIEAHVHEREGMFDVIFTMVEFPAGMTKPDDIPMAWRNISVAKGYLQDIIDAGKFSVDVYLNDGHNGHMASHGIPNSLRVLDSRDGHYRPGAKVEYKKGYTSGDMAGLAFGMILGGLLLSGVIYFFAMRNSVRAGIPVVRGFDNPLSGLSNLVNRGN